MKKQIYLLTALVTALCLISLFGSGQYANTYAEPKSALAPTSTPTKRPPPTSTPTRRLPVANGTSSTQKRNTPEVTNLWTSTGPEGGPVRAFGIDSQNTNIIYAVVDYGFFKSINGGSSWNRINNGLTNFYAQFLVTDPQNSGTIYAGTGGGLFKSTNAGASWIVINSGLTSLSVQALAIDPQNPNTIYVATECCGGVFKSTDGGGSWNQVNISLGTEYVVSLAIDPQNSGTVYSGTSIGNMFKTTNGGLTWSSIYHDTTFWYPSVGQIAIDPMNPNTVFAIIGGTLYKSIDGGQSWNGKVSNVSAVAINPQATSTIYAHSYPGLSKSNDGGESWTAVDTGWTLSSFTAIAIDPKNSGTIYAGTTNYGALKSTNAGENMTAINTGLFDRWVHAIAIDPQNPSTIYAGTIDKVSLFKSADGGTSWNATNSGLGEGVWALATDPINPGIVYAGTNQGIYKSTNGGVSWSSANTGFSGRGTVITLDPKNPSIIYSASYNGSGGIIFKSTNGGGSWNDTYLPNTMVTAIVIDPQNSNMIYAGTGIGVYKSTIGGGGWGLINGSPTAVQALVIDPQNSSTIYAGTAVNPTFGPSKVFKTTNGGGNWNAVYSSTSNYVEALLIDPKNPSTIYAGLSQDQNGDGVIMSTDGGNNWIVFNSGLTEPLVEALGIDPQDTSIIYAATRSGVFVNAGQLGSIQVVYPVSNATISSVMQGGTTYRYFRAFGVNNNPVPNASVNFSFGSPALSDAAGYFTATIPASALGGVGSYQVNVQSVIYGGQTYTNSLPSFGVAVTDRRFTNAWSYGASTRLQGGISAGLIAYLQRTASGGLELKLDESNPDVTSDDVVLMKEDFSDETGAGGGVGIEKGVSILVLQVKGGAQATSEFALRTIGSTQTRFSNPYSDNDRKGQGVYLLASAIDSMNQASPGKPFAITFLKLSLDRNAPYSSYISQQQAGFGSKITPLQANVGASASLGLSRNSSLWKAASLGFDLVDLNVNVVQMNTLTDYRDRSEWGIGYESEHNVDFTLLSPTAEVGKFKAKLALLENNQAKKVKEELIFDSNTNALKRLELSFTGNGNAGVFGGTVEEATAKIGIPASQLTSNRISSAVNILRLLQAAQQTGNNPLQIGPSATISQLNSLLSGLGYADYEYTVDDGTQTNLETELGITAFIKIELGPSFSVKRVRSLVRERGVFTNGRFYMTESYIPDDIVSRAGKSWQDLTLNSLGGLWLLVQDAFNSISQQVTSGVGWVLNIISQTAGITQGGAQLNVPSNTQLQRPSSRGPRAPLTDPVTVTVKSWVPTISTTNSPRRLRPDLAAATGEGFVVGGIYEYQPSTLTLSPAASLVITYTNEAATGKNKNSIGMFRWNETGNNWQSVGGQTPDPTNNTVTASITQLGTYALGYDVIAPQITNLTPVNTSTITNTLPIISALVTDTGVGINPSSLQMQLDGQIVAATFITGTGQLLFMPPIPLSYALHSVGIYAQDMAGNPTSVSGTFKVQLSNFLYFPLIKR